MQRLATLDAEAGAIETALASPRAESVVFQPGVGGTCAVCGELYGSAARFCSNCGSAVPAGPAARAEPSRPAPAPPNAPGAEAAEPGEQPTRRLAPAGEPAASQTTSHETARRATAATDPGHGDATDPGDDAPGRPGEPGEPGATAAGAATAPADESGALRPLNPLGRSANGRSGDHAAPGLSPGDPLAGESRS